MCRSGMKYPINKEFGIFRKFKPPMNKAVFRLALAMPKCLHSNSSVSVKRIKAVAQDGKEVQSYVFSPKDKFGKLPTIFFLHGGGFVFKGTPYHYKQAQLFAEKLCVNVVFVDYRLAFQGEYLASLNDCFATYCHVLKNSDVLHVDVDNIGVAGDSAGGYLSLSLTQTLFQRKLVLPKFQMLVYPVVDPEMSFTSMKQFVDTPMWNTKANTKMWEIYSKGNKPYNPLCDDLSFMPTTYIETAQFDCLHDEGVALYNKMCNCGVKCVLNQTSGTMHGFDICRNAQTTQTALQRRIEVLKQFLQSNKTE